MGSKGGGREKNEREETSLILNLKFYNSVEEIRGMFLGVVKNTSDIFQQSHRTRVMNSFHRIKI